MYLSTNCNAYLSLIVNLISFAVVAFNATTNCLESSPLLNIFSMELRIIQLQVNLLLVGWFVIIGRKPDESQKRNLTFQVGSYIGCRRTPTNLSY